MSSTKQIIGYDTKSLPVNTDSILLQSVGGVTERIEVLNFLKNQVLPCFVELSNTSDIVPVNTTENLASFNSQQLLNNVTHSTVTNPENITIDYDGYYILSVQGYVAKTSGSNAEWVDIWIKNNSSALPNTSMRTVLKDSSDADSFCFHRFLNLSDGDVLNIALSISNTALGVGLYSITPSVGPVVPSIKVSLYRLG